MPFEQKVPNDQRMDSNKDEALKCVSVASRALSEGDLAKAERFASKAFSMAASLREVSEGRS
jgi:hypothetical protein